MSGFARFPLPFAQLTQRPDCQAVVNVGPTAKNISFSQQKGAKYTVHVTPPPVQALLDRPPTGLRDCVSARRPARRYAYIRFPTPQASSRKLRKHWYIDKQGCQKYRGYTNLGLKTVRKCCTFTPPPGKPYLAHPSLRAKRLSVCLSGTSL